MGRRSIWDEITIPSPLEILEAQKEWMEIKTKGQVIPEVSPEQISEKDTRCYFEIGGYRILCITHSYSWYPCQCRFFCWDFDDREDVEVNSALELTTIIKDHFFKISEIIQRKLIPAGIVQWALSNTPHNDQPTITPSIGSLWPEIQEISPLDILKHQAEEAKILNVIVEEKNDGIGTMYIVTPTGEKIEIFSSAHDVKNIRLFIRNLFQSVNEKMKELRYIAMDTQAKRLKEIGSN